MTTIVGGGLAGLCLVRELVERGVEASTITVVDGADERRGSAVPAAMLHAFPGRRMSFRRGQGDAFVRSWSKLTQWRENLGGDWVRQAPMVRPLTDDDRGQRLRDTWENNRDDYPKILTSRILSPEQLAEEFPHLRSKVPVVVYGPAASVFIPELVRRLKQSVVEAGVEFVDARVDEVAARGAGWRLECDDGAVIESDAVVLAPGPWLADFFPGLDLRRRAGELAVFEPNHGASLNALVNAGKHLCERPDGCWGLGSTYFGVDQWEERDEETIVERLTEGVRAMLPAIDEAELVQLWRGVRGVFGSDHMPLVGPVPGAEGLYSFGAFGSKGLLWIPSAAADMARWWIDGDDEALNHHMDTRRMSVDKWRLNSRSQPSYTSRLF